MRRQRCSSAAQLKRSEKRCAKDVPAAAGGARGTCLGDGNLESFGQRLFDGLRLASGGRQASAALQSVKCTDVTGRRTGRPSGSCLHDLHVLLQRVQLAGPHPGKVTCLALARGGGVSRQTLASTGQARRRAGGAAAPLAAAGEAARAPLHAAWHANRRARRRTLAQEGPKYMTHSESRCAAAATFSGTSARLVGSATRPCDT